MKFSRLSGGEAHDVSRNGIGILALCLVAGFAVIAPAAVFFWPDNNRSLASSVVTDQMVADKLDDIGAAQQQTTSAIKTVKDAFANERTNLKTLSDQFSALTERLNTLQGTTTQILHDNERLSERLAEIQIQMVRNSVSVAEQLTALTQTIHDDAVAAEQRKEQMDLDVAKDSEILQSKKLPPPSASATRNPAAAAQALKPDRTPGLTQASAQLSRPAQAQPPKPAPTHARVPAREMNENSRQRVGF